MTSYTLSPNYGVSSYFDMQRFENLISNKMIVREQRIAKRKKIRVLDNMLMIVAFVLAVNLLIVVSLISYQNVKTFENNRQISRLEKQLTKLRTENDIAFNELKDKIKYDNLKMKAYLDLNMITPTEKNIIYFDKRDSGYVRQYENIR